MAGSLSSLHGPGQLNGSTEEEQFFRKGGFPGVRMADDAESAPSVNLSLMFLVHAINPEKNGCKTKKSGRQARLMFRSIHKDQRSVNAGLGHKSTVQFSCRD
jgi:hypothetical protein